LFFFIVCIGKCTLLCTNWLFFEISKLSGAGYRVISLIKHDVFHRQYEMMQRKARIETIEQTRLELAQAEERLFFFQHWDRYEMEKEEKVAQWVRTMPRSDWNLVGLPLQ
jgi:hypothetical protein